eukprot:scaffold3770_cov99-Skeletonema_dohrnii-CCMP3373.AAC.8
MDLADMPTWASSGHLQGYHITDTHTNSMSIIVINILPESRNRYYETLEAVDCHIRSVRYDMVVEAVMEAVSDGLIRSPQTL